MTSETLDGNDRLPSDEVRDLYASFTHRLELEPEMGIDAMRDLSSAGTSPPPSPVTSPTARRLVRQCPPRGASRVEATAAARSSTRMAVGSSSARGTAIESSQATSQSDRRRPC